MAKNQMQLGRNLTHQVMHQLGEAIVRGDYGPDNAFPIEAELCKQFDVSRSVLREAIKMLTAKGLLGSRPRQGTWIKSEDSWNLLDPEVLVWLLERKFSPALLMEFLQIRLAVEPMAAELAAEAGTRERIADIELALERMRAAAEENDDPLDSDIAFHVAILQASGNRFIARFRDVIDVALQTSIRLTNQAKGVRLASVADHKKVYDAIVARDSNRARETMRALIIEAMALVREMSQERIAR